MTHRRPDGASVPRAAVRAFGIDTAEIDQIRSGLVSWHWRVRTPTERFVLRRCNPFRNRTSILYEHGVLSHLGSAGWPVPVPIPAPGADTLLEVRDGLYALFPFMPGRSIWPRDAGDACWIGEVIARLHADTEPLTERGQRPGWDRLAAYWSRTWQPTWNRLEDALLELSSVRPDLVVRIERHHEAFRRTDIGEGLPESVVHGDFYPANVLWFGGRLSAVLDFDFTHLDVCVADLACALGFFGDAESRAAIVDGYQRVRRLSPEEIDFLGPLRVARGLEHAAHSATFWASGREDMLSEIERACDLMDADQAMWPDLRRRILAAT